MSLADETTKPRRSVVSAARATQIVEEIAGKHRMTPAFLLCARRDRFAMSARAETAHALTERLNWSQRRVGDHIGCSQPNVRKLLGYHKMNLEHSGRFLPNADLAALVELKADERLARAVEAEERAAYAESELKRLNGANLAMQFADALGLAHRIRCAIVLAIVVEAYPRVVLGAELVEHYDAACLHLGYGDRKGANFHLLTKNVAHLREHFAAQGWPVPLAANNSVTHKIGGARRLTDEAALFLHDKLGTPKLSQIEAALEQHSLRVRSSASK